MAAVTLEVLAADDVARLFRVSTQTVDNWIKNRKLPPPIRQGHRRLWRSEDIAAHLEKLRAATR